MTKNLGEIDRALRILAGIALVTLLVAGLIGAWGWVGLVPLATGLLGSCPLYRPFGLDTRVAKGRATARS